MSSDRTCPHCKHPMTGDSCPECDRIRSEPTKVLPEARLFADAVNAAPETQVHQPGDEFKSGDRFHGLEILSIAGRGGMGAVYKARQPALDRLVALKILPTDKADLVQFKDRFHREAKTLASLSHSNIVGIHDFGEEGGVYFFVMEYVEGMDLHDYLQEKKPGMEEIQGIFSQVCDAIDYAHSKDVIHRDIKPANILMDLEGRVKVADFGLAKLAQVEKNTLLTASGVALGTAHFMAPEQMNDAMNVDHRADLYSLGVMLYQMLTGEIPVGKIEPPSKVSPALAPFDPIIDRAMESRPDSRYQNAIELKSDVEKASSGETPVLRKKSRVLHRIAILLTVFLVGGYFLYREIESKKIKVPQPTPEVRSTLLEAFQGATAYASFIGMTSAQRADIQTLTLKLDSSEREKASVFLRNEILLLVRSWPKEEWLSRRKEAERQGQYCEFLSGIIPAGEKIFDPILADLEQVSEKMKPVIAWQGTFDLKIIPSPYAEVRGFKSEGGWVMADGKKVGEGLDTPVTIPDLAITSYMLVLSHPGLGEQEVAIPEEDLKNGKVYVVSGKMGKDGNVRLGIAP